MRLVLAVIVCLLLAPATAHAQTPPPTYMAQRANGNADLRTMILAGVGFWAQRGVTISGPVELLVADDVGSAQDGLGETPFEGEVWARSIAARDYGVNRIVLRSDWLRSQQREMRDPIIGRAYAAHVCAVLWHELGHIGGLANPQLVDGRWVDGHPATGLMSQQLTVPGDCRVLARRISHHGLLAHRQRHQRHASHERRAV